MGLGTRWCGNLPPAPGLGAALQFSARIWGSGGRRGKRRCGIGLLLRQLVGSPACWGREQPVPAPILPPELQLFCSLVLCWCFGQAGARPPSRGRPLCHALGSAPHRFPQLLAGAGGGGFSKGESRDRAVLPAQLPPPAGGGGIGSGGTEPSLCFLSAVLICHGFNLL